MVRRSKKSRALRTTLGVVSRNLFLSQRLLCLSPFPRNPWLEEVNRVERCEKKHLGFYTSSSRECTRCELQTQEMKFPRVCLRLERSETLAQTGTAITTRMKKS